MYVLAFDTTGAACSIILARDNLPLAVYEQTMDFGQAEVLMPKLQEILKSQSVNFADLEALFVCTGPGSFTGVRSSVAAARTFGLAEPRLQLGGISAFDAYLQSFDETELADLNAVIIETRRDDFYVQIFDRALQPLIEPQALSRDEIIARLKEGGRLVSVVGDGVERFLSCPSGLCLHAIKMFTHLPPQDLLSAGLKALSTQKLNYPKPLYLRAPDVCLPKS